MRRERKYSARRISLELAGEGITISVRTVSRLLAHLGLNRRRGGWASTPVRRGRLHRDTSTAGAVASTLRTKSARDLLEGVA